MCLFLIIGAKYLVELPFSFIKGPNWKVNELLDEVVLENKSSNEISVEIVVPQRKVKAEAFSDDLYTPQTRKIEPVLYTLNYLT